MIFLLLLCSLCKETSALSNIPDVNTNIHTHARACVVYLCLCVYVRACVCVVCACVHACVCVCNSKFKFLCKNFTKIYLNLYCGLIQFLPMCNKFNILLD